MIMVEQSSVFCYTSLREIDIWGLDMISTMTINDYDALFKLWSDTPNMGLRSLDDSRELTADDKKSDL